MLNSNWSAWGLGSYLLGAAWWILQLLLNYELWPCSGRLPHTAPHVPTDPGMYQIKSRMETKSLGTNLETGSELKIYCTKLQNPVQTPPIPICCQKIARKKSLVKLTGKWNGVVLDTNKKTGCFNYVGVLNDPIIILYYDKWRRVVFDSFLL